MNGRDQFGVPFGEDEVFDEDEAIAEEEEFGNALGGEEVEEYDYEETDPAEVPNAPGFGGEVADMQQAGRSQDNQQPVSNMRTSASNHDFEDVPWHDGYEELPGLPPGRKKTRRRAGSVPTVSDDDSLSSLGGDGLETRVNDHASRHAFGRNGGANGRADDPEAELFGDEDDDQGGAVIARRGTVVDARCFSDYSEFIMGRGISPKIPEFCHSSSTWSAYKDVRDIVQFMRPIRTLVWNIPVSLFARHSSRFRHWTTPQKNAVRAAHIGAVIGLCFTGTSKGFL